MIAAVRRGVAAEAVRTGGLRSVLLLGAVPAGVLLPMLMRSLRIDPALAGSVVLTTITDAVGFLSFLGLATLFYA